MTATATGVITDYANLIPTKNAPPVVASGQLMTYTLHENISILLLTGAYALMMRAEWHIHTIMVIFGLFISAVMTLIWKIHRQDLVH